MTVTRTVFLDTALSDYQSLATQYGADTFNVVLLNGASPHASQIQNWLTAHNANAADINIVSASTSVNGAFTPRVVFVDSSVANVNTVIAGVPANATVVVLDASKDGVQQIRDYLAANTGKVGAIDIVTDLASIDVVSHGSPGEIMLGSTVLNATNLASYTSQLADIGSHLTAGADLLLYGCDVASGTTGQQFISALAAATGADVAASTDLTGSAAAGGDWVLEASTGAIETAALNIAGYDGLLGNVTKVTGATLSDDKGISPNDYITNVDSQTVTFTGSLNGSPGNTKVWVSTDGIGTNRAYVDVTVSGQTYSVAPITLLEGSNRSIQFWDGNSNQKNGSLLFTQIYTLDQTLATPTISLKNDTGAADGRTADATLVFNTPESDVTRVIKLDNNTYNPATVSEGGHTVTVTDTDTAGNTKTTSFGFTLDTTITTPTVSLFADSGTTGDNRTNDARLTFNAKDSDATRVIKLDGQTINAYDPTGLGQGSHTVTVTDTDGAGNSKSATLSFFYDTHLTAPTVSLTTDSGKAGDGHTNDASLTFNTADSDATRVITVDGQSVTAYDPKALLDGEHTVTVTDSDGANSATKSVTFTLDRKLTAPTVSLTTDSGKAGDGHTNDASLTFNAADSDATRVITVDGQSVTAYDPKALLDGEHTVTVTDSDGANSATKSVTFTLDRKLTAPTVSLTTDSGKAGDGHTNDASLTFNTADSDATRVITVDGQSVTAYDPKALLDGEHTVTVTDSDGANSATKSVTFTLDTKLTAPTVSLTTDSGKAGDGHTNDASLTFNAADSDATRVITVDGQSVTAYDPKALLDGEHTVTVTDSDGANSATKSVTFTLDTKLTAPTVSLTTDSGKAGDGHTNDASLTFNAADSDATRVITVDGKEVQNYDAKALADGEHTVTVTDSDGANTATKSVTFTLDTKLTAPTVSLTTDSGKAGDGRTNDASLTFNTIDSDATRIITVDGKEVQSYDAKALADGEHTVTVTDSDGANSATKSVTFTLDTKLTAPTVSLTTDSGKAGDGHTNDASLTFNTADSDATRVITVDGKEVQSYDAKVLADGEHTVTVTDSDGANSATKSVTFTLDTKLTAPTVSLTTDSGKAGDGRTNDASLTFNTADSDATRIITVDGKEVQSYDAKALADGEHTVTVTDSDGANSATKSVTFTLDTKLTAPTVSLTTDSGKAGDGHTNDASLTFNTADSDATRVITVDGKEVQSYDAKALADGEHTVTVTDSDGANSATKSVTFTLDTKLTAPTVSLTTDSGKAGDGRTNDASLTFNAADSDATRVITVDGKEVQSYDAKALADGEHTVTVTDSDGANSATKSVTFTLDTKLTAPTVSLTTDSGKAGDGHTNDASLTFSTADSDATRVITVDGKEVQSYDAKALADGEHTVTVTDSDGANSATKSVTFTLDTKLTAPTVSLTTDSGKAGDGHTNDASLSFNAADSDATRVITVDGQSVTAYDPKALLDGEHTVTVTDSDGANSATKSVTFTLDTKLTAPTVSLTTDSGKAGDGHTNDASLTFNAADSDATRVITVDGKEVQSYDAKALADGEHTVTVTDSDGANSASKSVTFTLDTKLTAPTVSLTTDSGKAGDGRTNDASLTFNTADSDATRVITVDGKEVQSYDAKALADGEHTVTVTDSDGANTATKSVTFTLDTKLTAPTVSLTTDSGKAGDGRTNDASLTFNTADSDATRVITVDGKEVQSYDAKALADGEHTVTVTDSDGANSATKSVTFTLDTKLTAPTVSLTTDSGKAGDGHTNDASLTFSTADSDATRVITVDGKEVQNYDAKALADGEHTVTVTDSDGANSATKSVTFTLDTKLTAPTVSLTTDSGKAGDGHTNDASLTFNTADSDATRVITVDGKEVQNYDAKALADGEHTVTVTDSDGANTATKSVTFTLDTKLTAPTVSLTTDSGKAGDGRTNDASLTFNAADSDATRVITVDGKEVQSYDAKALADGEHTVTVTDSDGANSASKSVTFTLDTKLTAPTVSLTTDSGKAGDGRTNDASLTFNTIDSDATRIITVDGKEVQSYDAKALADGEHTVTVTDSDGANSATKSVTFTLDTKLTAPTVSLTTDSGKAGDGHTNDASLTFNTADSDATRVITVDGKEVQSYDAKALADGEHTVTVTDSDGANSATKSVTFTLDTKLTAPTVSLTTDSGKAGDGRTNDASLTFNTIDSDATRVITVDGKEVQSYDAKALADGEHTVTVTDSDGANSATKSVTFTLDTKLTAPTVSLTTDSGKAGDGHTNDASLSFNAADSDATRVITVDGQSVTAYDPKALLDGEHTVTVTDSDGANSATKSVTFTLDTKLTAPTVSLTTDSGKAGDGRTNDASLTFNAADSDATRVITVDGKEVQSYDAKALADGEHTVTVTDSDGANSASKSVTFTLDTKLTAPTVSLTTDSGKAGDGLTNSAGLIFSTADSDATRAITVDGQSVTSYDPTKLADGSHTVLVTDADGANSKSSTFTFTLDSKGPLFSSAATASVAENIGENKVVYTAAATDDHGVSYSLDGADAARFLIGADGGVTLNENPNFEVKNSYGFSVVGTDAAGNHTSQSVTLNITNVNEAPVATNISKGTVETTPLTFQILGTDQVSDPDAGDKLALSLVKDTATLSWANTDGAPTTLINPVTKAVVDISTLSVKASISADGTSVTLTPPAELDWLVDHQNLKATFTYTITDMGGLKSQASIDLVMTGTTNESGLTLNGGNGDDTLSGNASNNGGDMLMGGNGNDTLYGYGGTDVLYGGNGNDKLYGGAGIDYLYGDSGDDTIYGGADGDYIFGGKGNDILWGEGGADKFVFAPQNGNDRIMDFKASDGDMLYFTDFFTTAPTVDAFLSKYVTDTGNDLLISLPGTTIVLVGVANISDLQGHIAFGSAI